MCEVGQEKDENGIWKWVLPYANPCACTSVRFGGINTRTPIRPFKPTYASKPLVSTDAAKIRQHYRLHCKGKKEHPSKVSFFNVKICSNDCSSSNLVLLYLVVNETKQYYNFLKVLM